MVANNINNNGYREAIGVAEDFAISKECRRDFPT